MNCLEAQSKIIAYIDNKLEKEEKTDFLKHITRCKDCKEELNIYYTMIEGMRQLDSNLPLSRDFSKELDERINRPTRCSCPFAAPCFWTTVSWAECLRWSVSS